MARDFIILECTEAKAEGHACKGKARREEGRAQAQWQACQESKLDYRR